MPPRSCYRISSRPSRARCGIQAIVRSAASRVSCREMPSRLLEAEIDRLYQLPLDEFTAARNALAKGAGGDAGRVRALGKPSVPAWIVNQLFWRDRQTWDALIAAAENARKVNRAVLAGKSG